MIFSKNIKSDFAFDFGGVSIAPAAIFHTNH
jgi:hypothetical protein